MTKPIPAARIYFIVARNTNVAVIFRKGPTKWTQLIKWNLDNDKLHYGQWFKGKIYERRSDLSPSGNLLVYFASKHTRRQMKSKFTSTWTAVSKPPYYTAAALWPKGDTWGGGGLFVDDNSLLLNHPEFQSSPHPDFEPKRLKMITDRKGLGINEDETSYKLTRSGWKKVKDWEVFKKGGNLFYKPGPPEVREKKVGSDRTLVMERYSNDQHGGKFSVKIGKDTIPVENAQWLDSDHKGRIILAMEGKLYASVKDIQKNFLKKLKLIADLNESIPEAIKSPDGAGRL